MVPPRFALSPSHRVVPSSRNWSIRLASFMHWSTFEDIPVHSSSTKRSHGHISISSEYRTVLRSIVWTGSVLVPSMNWRAARCHLTTTATDDGFWHGPKLLTDHRHFHSSISREVECVEASWWSMIALMGAGAEPTARVDDSEKTAAWSLANDERSVK